jgi:hypothetical protein
MWVSRHNWEQVCDKMHRMEQAIQSLEHCVRDYTSPYNGTKVAGLDTRVIMIEEALKLNLPTHVPAHWELNRKGKSDG